MSNIMYFYNNLLDTSSVTASSEATNYPASNLKNHQRSMRWLTEGAVAGTANLVINLGTTKAMSAIILTDHDWKVAPGTLDLELSNYDGWGSPKKTIDLSGSTTFATTTDAYGVRQVIVKTFDSTSYMYARLNVVNAAGDWKLGRVFLGTYYAPSPNLIMTYKEKIIDPSKVDISVDGQKHTDEVSSFRRIDWSCFLKTYAQWQSFQGMFNEVGKGKDLFVAFDYNNYHNAMTMYGRMVKFDMTKDRNYNIKATFEESV